MGSSESGPSRFTDILRDQESQKALDQYAQSAGVAQDDVAKLRSAYTVRDKQGVWYKTGDETSVDISSIYQSYMNWLKTENQSRTDYQAYLNASAARPGRAQTILVGQDSAQKQTGGLLSQTPRVKSLLGG